jgi:hypothetical protein
MYIPALQNSGKEVFQEFLGSGKHADVIGITKKHV